MCFDTASTHMYILRGLSLFFRSFDQQNIAKTHGDSLIKFHLSSDGRQFIFTFVSFDIYDDFILCTSSLEKLLCPLHAFYSSLLWANTCSLTTRDDAIVDLMTAGKPNGNGYTLRL